MIQFRDLHEYACTRFGLYFTTCTKFKKDFSVFEIPFKRQILHGSQVLHDYFSCSDFFIALYWLTFVVSSVGLFEACKETFRVFTDEDYEPVTFGNRTYEYVSLKFRRHARICGLALNIKLFIGLLYGLMRQRTSYILPWIVVYGVIIPLEVFYWACEIFGKRKWKFEIIPALFALTVRWALTLHIMVLMDKNRFD